MKRKVVIALVILALILAIGLIIFAFCNDGKIKNREFDAEIVKEEALVLIKDSEKLNELLFGEGIRWDPNPAYANGNYYKADEFSLDDYGVLTVADIKNLMKKTFSDGYCKQIYSSPVFTVAYDANGNISYFSRYIQKGEENSPEYIMIYKEWEKFLYDTCVYDYTTVKATHSVGERVMVEIYCTVTDSETKKTETKRIEVALIEESDGWRIDSPTYCEIEKEAN